MGGEIGVDSELGVGSTFFIRAPFKLQSQQRELLVDGESLLGMPILVVDDNASARGIFHNMLSSLKFDVATASSAAEAIGLLADACAAGPARCAARHLARVDAPDACGLPRAAARVA